MPALALLALSTAALAQTPDARLEGDLAFVRALAKELRCFDLARLEAENLARTHRKGLAQDKIALVTIEISREAARTRRARVEARNLYRQALDKAKELRDRTDDAQLQLETCRTLANLAHDYGQFLAEELEIAHARAPERVVQLEAEASAMFRAGLDACAFVSKALTDAKDENGRLELLLVRLKSAVLLREQGRCDRNNRSVLVARAVERLTELVLEVGEETTIGVRGMFEIALCKEVDGRIDDAIDGYRSAIRHITASLQQAQRGDLPLSPEMRRFLFAMLQEVHARAGETMLREGDPACAELFASFQKALQEFGPKNGALLDVASADHGHLLLLAKAQFDAESGDGPRTQQALQLARDISVRHPSDFVGARAKTVLESILQRRPDLATAELLLELGRSALHEKQHEVAVIALRKSLAVMTPAEQEQHGVLATRLLGLAFANSDRPLEAMLALGEGLHKLGRQRDPRTLELAEDLHRAIAMHRRATRNDAAFEPRYAELAALLAQFADAASGASALLQKGAELFNQAKYRDAIDQLRRIPKDQPSYDPACVLCARAEIQMGRLGDARATLAAHATHRAENPLPPGDVRGPARERATIDAEFLDVQMHWLEARGAKELGLSRDMARYPAAIEKARAFIAAHDGKGEQNLPAALEFLGRLDCDLAKTAAAEQTFARLKALDPVRASRLASELFREYQNQVRLLLEEHDRAAAAPASAGSVPKAAADLEQARRRLVTLGLDYAGISPKPQLPILIGTLVNLEALQEWAHISEIGQQALAIHGDDSTPTVQGNVDRFVRPVLGTALRHLRRCTEAYAVLQEAERRLPEAPEVRRQLCLTLGGWLELDRKGSPVQEPGLDRPDEAYTRLLDYDKLPGSPAAKPWSLAWYTWRWELYWFARKAAAKDNKWQAAAETVWRIARATDDFAALRQHGPAGVRLARFFTENH